MIAFFDGENVKQQFLDNIVEHRFKNHLLVNEDKVVKELYCVGLLAFFRDNDKKMVDALMHMGKIVFGYSHDTFLYECVVKAFKSDKSLWDDVRDLIRGELAYNFCVDVLLIAGKDRIDAEKMIENLALKLDIVVKDCILISSKIQEKDYVELLLLPLSANIDLRIFLGYFTNYSDILRKIDKEVGDILKIGNWNEKYLDWEILEIKDNEALVLSKYIVKKMSYEFVSWWAESSIRQWLNEDFYSKVFNNEEKNVISTSMLPSQSMFQFYDTNDRLFLLSTQEAFRMLKGKDTKCCELGMKSSMKWWLRTPGKILGGLDSGHVFVDENGDFKQQGVLMVDEYVEWGIRPAMRISLSKVVRLELEAELKKRKAN